MLLIPEIQINKALDYLFAYYYNDYKLINQVYIYGNKDMTSGFDWSVTPQAFKINGVEITINEKTTTLAQVVSALNAALISNSVTFVQFFSISSYICLKTVSKSSSIQTVLLELPTGDSIYDTIGIYPDTYSGNSVEHSLLYNYFGGQTADNHYNYFDEIVKILTDTIEINKIETTNKRACNIRLHFNPNIDLRPPIIIISLQSESEEAKVLGIQNMPMLGDYLQVREKVYNANYKITIFSDSANETTLLYHFVKALLKANVELLADTYSLLNLTVSGGDMLSELESPTLFTKILQISFLYVTYPIVGIDRGKLNTSFTIS